MRGRCNQPFIVNGLDDESQGGADSRDILVHNLLDNSCFTCIIQPAEFAQQLPSAFSSVPTYSIRILISLSFSRAFRKTESILPFSLGNAIVTVTWILLSEYILTQT